MPALGCAQAQSWGYVYTGYVVMHLQKKSLALRCFLWAKLGATISLVFVPLCLGGEIVMPGPHHKDTKAQRKIFWITIPTQFSEELKVYERRFRST